MFKLNRQGTVVTSALLLLPACSLLIDTTPDGVKRDSGAAGQSSVSASSSTSAGAPLSPLEREKGGNVGTSLGLFGGSSSQNHTGATDRGGTASGTTTSRNNNGGSVALTLGGTTSTTSDALSGGAQAVTSSTSSGGTSGGGVSASGGIGASGSGANGGSATGGAVTGGATMGGSTAGTGCTGNLETVQISSRLCVARMASITPPTGAAAYSINVTEVTRGQYASWVASNPLPQSAIDPKCGWNTTFVPDSACMARACKTNCDHHPQVCVDWCDACRYCWALGKLLGGKIGGGQNPWTENANSETSQWHRACTSGGKNTYPYGSVYEPAACNDYSYWAPDYNTTTVEVGSLPGCQSTVSGYTGVFDLSGSVMEWENSCEDDGPDARCNARGGLYFFDGPALTCDSTGSYFSRNAVTEYVGFRC